MASKLLVNPPEEVALLLKRGQVCTIVSNAKVSRVSSGSASSRALCNVSTKEGSMSKADPLLKFFDIGCRVRARFSRSPYRSCPVRERLREDARLLFRELVPQQRVFHRSLRSIRLDDGDFLLGGDLVGGDSFLSPIPVGLAKLDSGLLETCLVDGVVFSDCYRLLLDGLLYSKGVRAEAGGGLICN